ncbi:hypothetical protein KR51_00002300 [Rubidibacter lacunae KORDI 51-2]|uniref:Transmembrane protein n=1 Tax=Rubidibacter lacunae KORDI 51-2 TaxID=582515 RepID=U5DPY6_9CHRO|nr:hypothetical protein [Rubidibacter lacunae]ERN42927.1 hypothetical protein KR51_00002300 [Rubidibacter lacunae KORDI 51-2]
MFDPEARLGSSLPVPDRELGGTTSPEATLEALLGDDQKKTLGDPGSVRQISQEDRRRNYETRVSGELAYSLWITLAVVASLHAICIGILTWHLVHAPGNDEEAINRRFDRALNEVHDTAKTIYTFLTPLATAVTGYYFANTERSRD